MPEESAEKPGNIVDFPGKNIRPNPEHFAPVSDTQPSFFSWLKNLGRDKPPVAAKTREEAKSRLTLVKPLDKQIINPVEDENSSGGTA